MLSRRRRNIFVFGVFLLYALTGLALQGRGAKVAVVSKNVGPYQATLDGFQRSAKFDYQVFTLEDNESQNSQVAKNLNAARPSLIIAVGTEAVLFSKNATFGLPIIYTMVLEPIQFADVQLSGITIKVSINDQLSRIKKILPKRKTLGVIYTSFGSGRDIEEARSLIDKYELAIYPISVETMQEASQAISKLTPGVVDILWMVLDKNLSRPEIVQQMIQHSWNTKLPLIGLSPYHVKAGALAAFSVDFADVGAQTAAYTQSVLAGEKVKNADAPRKVLVYVNTKIQAKLGITDLVALPDMQQVQ